MDTPSTPTVCGSHPDRPIAGTCSGCGGSFCEECLVRQAGQTWCSICGEDRVRQPAGTFLGADAMMGLVGLLLFIVVFFGIWIFTISVDRWMSSRGATGVAVPAPIVTSGQLPTLSKEAFTKLQLAMIAQGIDAYAKDAGSYPIGDMSAVIAVTTAGGMPIKIDRFATDIKDYVDTRAVPVENASQLQDGWDGQIFYLCPGERNPGGYDLYSGGPNRQDEQGGGDDILYEPEQK